MESKLTGGQRLRSGLLCIAACICALAIVFTACPQKAQAAQTADRDYLIGAFTYSDANWSDGIYASLDGRTFVNMGDAFSDRGDHKYANDHWCMSCPSIIYRDGYFWMLSSGGSQPWNPGKIPFVVSYSKDLVTWSMPWGFEADVTTAPAGADLSSFDVIAPEWFLDDNGDLYILLSLGYYGEFHGNPTNDEMQPYLLKVNELSAAGDPVKHADGLYYPDNLKWNAGTAVRLDSVCSQERAGTKDNLIDGCIYKEKGTYYLIIKNKGLWNDVFSTTDLMSGSWKKVNPYSITMGYEAPSAVNYNGSYRCFVDGVVGTKPVGTVLAWSKSLSVADWPVSDIQFLKPGGAKQPSRHGSVFVVKAGTDAWNVVHDRLAALGFDDNAQAGLKFSDIAPNTITNKNGIWYLSYLKRAVDEGIMSGYADGSDAFGPEDPITRAQVVTVFYRAYTGKTAATTDNNVDTGFKDAPSGQWYSAAVRWAADNEIVTGFIDPKTGVATEFRPDQPITREQYAAIAYRFTAFAGGDTSIDTEAGYNAAPDKGSVSSFAVTPMKWCFAHGVITGDSVTKMLNPSGNATRSQASKISTVTLDVVRAAAKAQSALVPQNFL